MPPIEAPGALAATLRRFLQPCQDVAAAAAAEALFEAGLANRRRVLGDAWVEKSLANRTDFNADFQAMITRIAWQEIWGRPGLDDRTRRLLVLAMTASLGRWEEFALHVRAALRQGGFTQDELKETLMQIALYAGVPAANTAFAEAGKIITEEDGTPKIVEQCTLPLTGSGVVDLIVTDLCVFAYDKVKGGLTLVELAPDVTLDEVVKKAAAPYVMAKADKAFSRAMQIEDTA